MYRIFIVEDDPIIAKTLKEYLERWNFQIALTEDFSQVLAEFGQFDPHLVLLDISLPFFNGYYWCGEIRKISKVPILFLSSASDKLNQVMAMNLGGDDFIPKPFDLEMLLAKIQALLRRSYDFSGQTGWLSWNGLLFSPGEGIVTQGENREELTKNENRILQVLLENRGQTVSRQVLMNRLWESDAFVDENTLTVNVARLRKKLEALGAKGMIKTKKGEGYLVE
ncbi:MAG TPA: response regulator transcription factor [Candidatus Egerieicola pullicola]|uniref:Stage 0 sporulation protein A homolog n=1 Tax=Candidatus Egerieicola pullicola TaxID=2840775 RepID=A0A9D1AKU5_9FIRM|nr:response regulator transcription factor [Candidatus Egerieicola pullicola]